jgi:chitin disaccharide deacetylase
MQQKHRCLIVNADDFGQSPGINAGIIQAHHHGIVTSASLMVRGQAATAAASYARAHPTLSVGLHIDLGEWAYREGMWVRLYDVVPVDDPAAIAGEIDRQLERFYTLVGRPPTHLDSHQHVHRAEPTRAIVRERAERLAVPLREETTAVRYCGAFYGQTGKGEPWWEAISVNHLIELFSALPPGYTELGCHPSAEDDLDSMYRSERLIELATLCDSRTREALEQNRIELCSFHHVTASL